MKKKKKFSRSHFVCRVLKKWVLFERDRDRSIERERERERDVGNAAANAAGALGAGESFDEDA